MDRQTNRSEMEKALNPTRFTLPHKINRRILVFLYCTLAACSSDVSVESDESFTIVMLPDTQNAVDYTRQKTEGFAIDSSNIFIQQMSDIASKSTSNGGKVVFVSSVGDVWQHVTSNKDTDHFARGVDAIESQEFGFQQLVRPEGTLNFELPKSVEGYTLLDNANLPFGVAPGNHDYDAWWAVALESENLRADSANLNSEVLPEDYKIHVGGLNNFCSVFGSDSDFYRDKDWYIDGYQCGGSSAQLFSAGGYRFLHFALEMQAGEDVVNWARQIVKDHLELPTIISTHDYLNPQGQRLPNSDMDLALVDPVGNNSSEELWRDFISNTDQIFMILSGHQPGQAVRIDKNDFGHEVYQILADFQDRGQAGLDGGQPPTPRGTAVPIGDGWYREMNFDLAGETPQVEIRTYSSHYKSYSSDLETYALWYKSAEQPDMTDSEFLTADEFTIELIDFHTRYGTSN